MFESPPSVTECFWADRSTIDMNFIDKALQQTCREKQIALYLTFLDIAKAYDSATDKRYGKSYKP